MFNYLTPGVYFESSDANRQAVDVVRTDIAAFIGVAMRGPLHTPTPVRSWAQFSSIFGEFLDGCYLAFAVKAFFENGGQLCYIVRVASGKATAAQVALPDKCGQPTLIVCASSPGAWGNQLSVRVNYTSLAATRTGLQTQPDDRKSSLVNSVVGFEPGALVQIYQDHGDDPACPSTIFRYVKSVDPFYKRLEWDQPLCNLFNLDEGISFETREFSLDVYYQDRLQQVFPRLSLYDPKEGDAQNNATCGKCSGENRPDHHAERVINNAPLALIQVCDLHSSSLYEDRLPAQSELNLFGGEDGLDDLALEDLIGQPGEEKLRGLRTLEPVDQISILAIPDLLMHALPPAPPSPPPKEKCPPLVPRPVARRQPFEPRASNRPLLFSQGDIYYGQMALVEHCELLKDRVALLDPPFLPEQDGFVDFGEIQSWRRNFDTSYAALYYPWVMVYDPLQPGRQQVTAIPPCGHVAGEYARTDLQTGVHKAPANRSLNWVQDIAVEITPEIQGALNPIGVNCIRSFPGRGIRIYGARTVSSDPLWRYINVRRLLIMIEESLDISCQYAVFEPNNFTLRQALTMSISNFLTTLWRAGALNGARASDAFLVQCDELNNPPELADNGQLVVDVLVAPVKPAEFVVIRIGRTEQELQISEIPALAMGSSL